jgi:hypothetical protein
MATAQRQSRQPAADKFDDESAVTILRHLEEERGKLFTEAEYREMRGTVLDELAHGARLRPFTLFTFATIGLGLLALLVIGVASASGNRIGDYTLALVSAVALATAGYYFWSCLRGIRQDAQRSLDTRLAELEQLREHRLVSPDEYHQLQAHILIARQHGA